MGKYHAQQLDFQLNGLMKPQILVYRVGGLIFHDFSPLLRSFRNLFDFTFPDAWSRKKIKAPPSRRPEVSAEMWNEVYAPTYDLSRLRWSGEVKVVMLEVAKECRGGSYITIEVLAPHGEESVEFLVNDELFYHAGEMTVPARPDSGIDTRQGPSGPKPKPDANDDELMDRDDDDIGGKTEKPGETDLGALERDLLEYRFSEDDDGEVDGSQLLMTPSSFMSPTKQRRRRPTYPRWTQ